MSSGSFAIALGIGAAALAFWVQFRFPNLTPQNLGWAIFHLFIAGALAQLTKAVFGSVELQPLGTMALVFGLALPTLVYSFVAGMWLVRIAQGVTGRGTTH
jgi:hypothetical protein